MKIKDGFILKNIAGKTVAVPAGENLVNLQLMLTLNESGAFLWECLLKPCSEEDLVSALTGEYNVDAETAKKDVQEFISVLKENQILDEA